MCRSPRLKLNLFIGYFISLLTLNMDAYTIDYSLHYMTSAIIISVVKRNQFSSCSFKQKSRKSNQAATSNLLEIKFEPRFPCFNCLHSSSCIAHCFLLIAFNDFWPSKHFGCFLLLYFWLNRLLQVVIYYNHRYQHSLRIFQSKTNYGQRVEFVFCSSIDFF